MFLYLLSIFYLMLPAYFANMAPILFRKTCCCLDMPIDFGAKLRGRPLFGHTKTIRGFVVGVLSAIVIVYLQSEMVDYFFFNKISIINYKEINIFLLGFLFGFGALFGDLVESFIKRRLGKKSSESLKIWDQIDYVIGSLALVLLYERINLIDIISIFLISFVLTVIFNHLGFYTKVRGEKW